MEKHAFGKTDLQVTPIGFGACEIGSAQVTVAQAEKILATVLDCGINVIDTASCYDESEMKIGEAISHRREEFVLISKCGHARGDLAGKDWSPALIAASVEKSLVRMKTDYLDAVLLHSCSGETLKDQDMLALLQKMKDQGKTRYIGLSSDGDIAAIGVSMDMLDVLETSVNLFDQQCLRSYIPQASKRGMGIILKRPLGNACWRKKVPDDIVEYVKPYIQRMGAMGLSPEAVGFDGTWIELAIRFSVYQVPASTAIIGSTKVDHLKSNIAIVDQGPLPEDVVENLLSCWDEHADSSWVGRT